MYNVHVSPNNLVTKHEHDCLHVSVRKYAVNNVVKPPFLNGALEYGID